MSPATYGVQIVCAHGWACQVAPSAIDAGVPGQHLAVMIETASCRDARPLPAFAVGAEVRAIAPDALLLAQVLALLIQAARPRDPEQAWTTRAVGAVATVRPADARTSRLRSDLAGPTQAVVNTASSGRNGVAGVSVTVRVVAQVRAGAG
jgi:hypothetical protein